MGQVIYAGGELDSVQVISGTPTESTALPGSYARGVITCHIGDCIRCSFYDDGGAALTVGVGETLFVHYFRGMVGAITAVNDYLTIIRDSAGFPWVCILKKQFGQGAIGIFGNTGTGASPTWTEIGSGTIYAPNIQYTDDIRVAIGADGVHEVEWAIDQTRVVLGNFTNVLFTNARSFDLLGLNNSNIVYRELLATEGLSTVGAHVATSALSGAGNQNTWGSGTYTDINEIPLNDTTAMSTTNAGDVATFACTDITTPVNYELPCVFVWTRGKNSGATPENIQTVFRISGTDYASASLASTGVSYTNQPTRYDEAPSGVPWTDVIFNAAERGVKSVA